MRKCEYCRRKQRNEFLVQTDDVSSGVEARIMFLDGTPHFVVDGWYDGGNWGAVGIGAQLVPINYCPICGCKLNKAMVE